MQDLQRCLDLGKARGRREVWRNNSNSPLTFWQFKLFGPYIGSDLIGLAEIAAAVLFIVGYLSPKAGIVGGLITCVMFFYNQQHDHNYSWSDY